VNVTIRLPEALRELTGGRSEIEVAAATVGEALERLAEMHPAIGSQIFDERRVPRGYVNTFLNDTETRMLEGVRTRVGSGDIITIVPSIAGGSAGTAGAWRKH